MNVFWIRKYNTLIGVQLYLRNEASKVLVVGTMLKKRIMKWESIVDDSRRIVIDLMKT
jgi:hypothetical protein